MSILNMANLKKIILFLILNIIILSNSHAEWEKFLSIEERNLDIFLDRQKVIGSLPGSGGGQTVTGVLTLEGLDPVDPIQKVKGATYDVLFNYKDIKKVKIDGVEKDYKSFIKKFHVQCKIRETDEYLLGPIEVTYYASEMGSEEIFYYQYDRFVNRKYYKVRPKSYSEEIINYVCNNACTDPDYYQMEVNDKTITSKPHKTSCEIDPPKKFEAKNFLSQN